MSHMLIIARQYDKEKGIYVRKLFGLGCNSKGALGLPINSNKDENSINSITEIPLFDENKEGEIEIPIYDKDHRKILDLQKYKNEDGDINIDI